MKAINRAIEILGLAGIGGLYNPHISPQAVHKWTNEDVKVPAERCPQIERATNGKVTCQELRPDVFGSAPPKPARKQTA